MRTFCTPRTCITLATTLLLGAMQLLAQSAMPAGTILPVRLDSSLNSKTLKPGQIVKARIAQDVPLPNGSKIRAGTKVLGHVVAVKRGNNSEISFRFDNLVTSTERIPITTNSRALASMMAIEEAQIPKFGPDRGTPENAWTTEQIGGEVVYRGAGPVANRLQAVGEPVPNGVLVNISGTRRGGCRGPIAGNDSQQALWLFSSNACGAYGFDGLDVVNTGRTSPVGEIILARSHGDVNVRAGSGMLLRVATATSASKD